MKTTLNTIRILLPILLMLIALPEANAQLLKKLGKTAEKAAERTVQRRVDRETTKKTDQALDSVLAPGSKGQQNPNSSGNDPNAQGGNNGGNTSGQGGNIAEGGPKTIQVYSKFDYVPGDKLMFYDDFGNDFIGDFPSKWNTNGSGEVVTINDSPQKWLKLLAGYNIFYIPDVPNLPQDYTIEFDLFTTGIDSKTSSTAGLTFTLSDNNSFKRWAALFVGLSPCRSIWCF